MLKLELNEVSQTIWIHLEFCRKALRRLADPARENKHHLKVHINTVMNMCRKATFSLFILIESLFISPITPTPP